MQPQKPTLGGLLRDAAMEFSGFKHGVPYTVRSLLSAPGATVRRYLDHHDGRITRPLRLFVFVLVVYLAVATLGGVDELNAQVWEQTLEPLGIGASGFTAFFARYQTALFALVLPLMMFATRVAWPRSGRTLAEHLILNTYLYSAQMAILIPLTLVAAGLALVGFDSYTSLLVGVVGPGLAIGYAAWMMATFFPGSRIWSAIRAIAIQFGMVIVYGIIVLVIFVLLTRSTGAGVG
jgi:hypothetical protein